MAGVYMNFAGMRDYEVYYEEVNAGQKYSRGERPPGKLQLGNMDSVQCTVPMFF